LQRRKKKYVTGRKKKKGKGTSKATQSLANIFAQEETKGALELGVNDWD